MQSNKRTIEQLNSSRRGFTILELLVASLLLGMLMTILTMIFNQSSIAGRSGMAGELDLRVVRENIAEVRDEADNAFVWNNKLYRHTSLWGADGQLRDRACDAPSSEQASDYVALLLGGSGRSGNGAWIGSLSNLKPQDLRLGAVYGASASSAKNFTVNVMSAGPDREFKTYDDIWSWPDDFD